MCISATVLAIGSLVAGTASAGLSIMSAGAQASTQQQQLELQRQQMFEEQKVQAMQAQQAEAARLSDFTKQRAANLAAMAAMGIGQHESFLQGISKAEDRALRMDLGNIRLGNLGSQSRLAADIRVNRLSSNVVSYNKGMAVMGSFLNLANTALNAGAYAKTYATPKPQKPTPTGNAIVGG